MAAPHALIGAEPAMPPGIVAHALGPGADAFATARALAAGHGGGSLFWVRREDQLDLAIVLEPEEPLRLARRAVCLGLLALADALALLAPPERPVAIAWPASLLVDGAVAGGGRLAWPAGADEDAPPAYLVFGARLRLAWPEGFETGSRPAETALAAEGFEEAGVPLLVERFARHMLFHADAWAARGFGAVAAEYARWLHPPGRLLENGDLAQGKHPLSARLLVPDWLEGFSP